MELTLKARYAWKSWKKSQKITIVFAVVALVSMAYVCWSPASVTIAWQNEILQQVTHNGVIKLSDLVHAYITQLPIIWLRIGNFWIEKGIWPVVCGCIITTMVALVSLMVWDPGKLQYKG